MILQDIPCTVNTQHDCSRNKCQTSGIRYVYQECMQTAMTTPVVEHLTNPDDLILNTAQMRDATHLQKFRIPSTALDEEMVIQESVAHAINQRKSAADGTSRPGKGRGRAGRGRGVVHGSNLAIDRMEGSSRHGRGRGSGMGSMLSADIVAGRGSSRQGSQKQGRKQGSVQPGELLLDFNDQ